MSQPRDRFNTGQPFNIGTGRVALAQLDTRLVGGAAQAAMMHFPAELPDAGFIQPALHALSPEGLSCGLAANVLRGGLHWQLDLPDNTTLIWLIPATARLLLIIDST